MVITLASFTSESSQAVTQRGGFIYADLQSSADTVITLTTVTFNSASANLDGGGFWIDGRNILANSISALTVATSSAGTGGNGGFFHFTNTGTFSY